MAYTWIGWNMIQVTVPNGQDGAVWSFRRFKIANVIGGTVSQVPWRFFNIPSLISPSPEQVMSQLP